MSTTSKKKKTTSKKDEGLTVEEDILMAAVDDEAPEVSIEDLPGVGPATAEKLREAGFDELLALAVMSPADLAEQAELGEAVAGKIINAAKKMANIGGFVSGVALLDRRREVQKLSSKVQSIDDLLGGGFETQAWRGQSNHRPPRLYWPGKTNRKRSQRQPLDPTFDATARAGPRFHPNSSTAPTLTRNPNRPVPSPS